MLTFKRKLILTKAQESRIDSWISTCLFVYNMALEIKITAWRNKQQSVHKYELFNQLSAIKNIEWIKDVPTQTLQLSIDRLDKSYRRFFTGAGFPKYANKKKYKSIHFRQEREIIKVVGNTINLCKLGFLKIFNDTPIIGNIKTVTIKKEPTGYFVFIVTDAIKSIQNQDESQILGLDMGIKHFVSDSNGCRIDNPKHFKKYERQLRIENRSLARKKKGSTNWKKQAKRLSLLHHKIGNVRRDFLHKESSRIAKENNMVILEDLNIMGMAKNKNLSKHILDAGWGTFRTMLSYKTNVVAINPKHTSQTCNECGLVDGKSRKSQSEFECTGCGHVSNADENAAKNIKDKGIVYLSQRKAIA